jgi:hypothetical protein
MIIGRRPRGREAPDFGVGYASRKARTPDSLSLDIHDEVGARRPPDPTPGCARQPLPWNPGDYLTR